VENLVERARVKEKLRQTIGGKLDLIDSEKERDKETEREARETHSE